MFVIFILFILFFNFIHFFILKPIFFRGFVVFRFELRRVVSRNKSLLIDNLGYFNSDLSFRFLSLNTLRFGL